MRTKNRKLWISTLQMHLTNGALYKSHTRTNGVVDFWGGSLDSFDQIHEHARTTHALTHSFQINRLET
uniref:Uncharacterized protein n=1 Tax=Anguilla anguilla TaxID=7936 RepID=A0A0E9X2Y1_ANGAN